MDAIPLTAEDRAILALESPTVAGHTCKVVTLGPGAPDAATLRAAIAARIEAAPALTRRLGGTDREPAWVPADDFDVSEHVADLAGDGPLDRAGLRTVVARLFAERLDRTRPLWRLDVVGPLEDGGAALVWRVHHALADGTAVMRFLQDVLWDAAPAATKAAAAARAAAEARARRHLASFPRRELARGHGRSPFDGRIGTARDVAFAATPLEPLHAAARALADATVNDAVLAVVGGGLRRWAEHHHGTLGDVRVRVPVSLHHPGDGEGNRDSFFAVALPLGEQDPIARLRAIRRQTAERKADHDAETMDALLRDLRRVSPRLERLAERIEASPRAFALNVSNVPGPRAPVSVLAAPVRALHSIAEIGERHALRVTVVSLAGTLFFGLCADPAIVDDLGALADGIEAEAAVLTA